MTPPRPRVRVLGALALAFVMGAAPAAPADPPVGPDGVFHVTPVRPVAELRRL